MMAIVIYRIIAENAVIEVLCVLTYLFAVGWINVSSPQIIDIVEKPPVVFIYHKSHLCVLFFFTDADLIFYPFYVFL